MAKDNLKWTTDKPTEDGRYFARSNDDLPDYVNVIVAKHSGEISVEYRTYCVDPSQYNLWLGPFEMTETNEEEKE